MRQWYALYCRSRQEVRAEDNLRRQGYRIFHPKLRVLKQHRDGLKPVIESLFPRYLFIHLDDEIDNWTPIRSTRGVVDLVRICRYPQPVPEDVIEQLLSLHSSSEDFIDHCTESDYYKGEKLRVMSGPFEGNWVGFLGRRADERVMVLLTIMNTAQKIELPAAAIARA